MAQARMAHQLETAMDSTQSRSNSFWGWKDSSRPDRTEAKNSGFSPSRTTLRARSPWRKGAAAQRALPSGVLGPFDLAPLAREDCFRRSELILIQFWGEGVVDVREVEVMLLEKQADLG